METIKALTIFREQLEKFVVFDEDQWSAFKAHLSFSTLKKKKHFATPGTICSEAGFVLTGSVRYYLLKMVKKLQGILVLKMNLSVRTKAS